MWSLAEATAKLNRLRQMPHGPARTAAAELIARTLEKEGPAERLPEALLELVEAYVFGSPNPASFAVFSKLLRLWDTHPEHFDEYDSRTLFWQFKWISGDIVSYPQISREQARGLLEEMRKRYRLAGFSDSAPDRAEFMWATHLGDTEAAEKWRAAWLSHGEDEMDCGSCRIGGDLRDLVVDGEYAKAVALGAPTEDLCNREPANSHRHLAMAYLHLGDGASAGRHLLRAQATRDQYDPDDVGLEFEILARGNRLDLALRLLVDQGKKALRLADSPGDNRNFLRYLVAGLAGHREERGDQPTGLKQAATVAGLYEWALEQAKPLSRAFDERAGNDRFMASLMEATQEGLLGQIILLTDAQEQATTPPPVALPGGALADPAVLAEGLLAAGDYAGAADCFEQAAAALAGAGRALDAGVALADAAQARALGRDYGAAHTGFARAWEALVSAGAEPILLLEVLLAWGRAAEAAGFEQAGQVAAVAREAQGLLAGADARLVAQGQDLLGRALAAAGEADAGDVALAAAQAWDAVGDYGRSAAALVVAGSFWLAEGAAERAVPVLEQAVSVLSALERTESKAAALDALVEALRATGQEHRVEELAEGLL